MTLTLAFYKGTGQTLWHRVQDGAIRFRTAPSWVPYRRATYSHVELIAGSAVHGETFRCYSSSGRDRGVRAAHILLKPESWDLVELKIDPAKPVAFIQDRIGARYDYTGILLSQLLASGIHDESKWFCSEIVAASLDLPQPHRVSPQLLFDIVTYGRRNP